jgi:hypothetical protein
LNMRQDLKNFGSLLPSKNGIGECIHTLEISQLPTREASTVASLRKRLTEEIVD